MSMKIIHCADLHLGSQLTSLPTGTIRNTRKNDILASFNRLIDYAKNNDIKIIVLSGDVFDSDRPTKKDKNFFYDAVRANRDITFLYLRGNHDVAESLTESLDNLKVFSDSWTSYKYDNVTISGIELSSNNKSSLYSTLCLDKDDLNVVMMHGDIYSKGKEYIDLKKLGNKNIDYLALGHIHKYGEARIDNRGIAVYPGCLDGRGFDELGEKGFVLLDIQDNTINYQFVPFSSRLVIEKNVDISNADTLYEAKSIVESEIRSISENSMVKIVLTGNVDFDTSNIDKDIESFLSNRFFFLKVYSSVKQNVKIEEFMNDLSLKGEFVRTVIQDQELKEDEQNEILILGMKLLNGEDIE